MVVRKALACALVLPLLGACGDSSEPSTATPAGVWSLSFKGPMHNVAGDSIGICHTEFVTYIYPITADLPYQFETRIPLAARPTCNDEPVPRGFPEVIVGVRQEGDQITFLGAGPTTIVTATYRGNSMLGTVPDRFLDYLGSSVHATRLPGTTDPNAEPTRIAVEYYAPPEVAVGDSILIIGSVKDGYDNRLHEEDVAWSSSDPSVAGVEDRGKDGGFYGTIGRVLGEQPGEAFIIARSGDLADSLAVTVFAP